MTLRLQPHAQPPRRGVRRAGGAGGCVAAAWRVATGRICAAARVHGPSGERGAHLKRVSRVNGVESGVEALGRALRTPCGARARQAARRAGAVRRLGRKMRESTEPLPRRHPKSAAHPAGPPAGSCCRRRARRRSLWRNPLSPWRWQRPAETALCKAPFQCLPNQTPPRTSCAPQRCRRLYRRRRRRRARRRPARARAARQARLARGAALRAPAGRTRARRRLRARRRARGGGPGRPAAQRRRQPRGSAEKVTPWS
jgi:hypothetical protein